jgi:hypothetical protein
LKTKAQEKNPTNKMKSYLSILPLAITALIFTSCAAVTNSKGGKAAIAKLPEPLKGEFMQITRQQDELGKQYTSGTRKMLEAYALIADAVGLKIEAAKLHAQAKAINSGSSLEEARKASSQAEPIIKAVRSKIAGSKGATVQSKETFASGVRAKNEAYITQANLAANASIVAVKGMKAMKSASVMEKVMLTATLDPLFFFSKDVPKFLAQEREFDVACKSYAKSYDIKIPTTALSTPKLAGF